MRKTLWASILLILLAAGCGQVALTPPPSPREGSPDESLISLAPVNVDQNLRLFDYDKTMPFDIQEGIQGHHRGIVAQDFTFASPKGGRVPATILTPPGSGPFAGIVMMHGMPGNRKQMLLFATAFAGMGAKVILIDAPFSRPENADRSEPLTFTSRDREEQIQLIVDLRRAIDILVASPDVDPERIAYIGVSYGGAMGGLLAGVEGRPKAYVLTVADGGLVTHVTSHKDPSFYALTAEEQQQWIADMWPIEPIHYIGRAAPAALLFLNGTLDQSVPPADALRYQEAASDPKFSRWYESGHALPPQAGHDQVAWLEEYISGGDFYMVAPSFRASALVIDRVLLAWFALTAGSLVVLLFAYVRKPTTLWRSRVAWTLGTAFFGPLGLLAYFLCTRQAKHSGDLATGKPGFEDALRLTVWSVSGNLAGGVIVLAVALLLSMSPVLLLALVYAMALVCGLAISTRIKRPPTGDGQEWRSALLSQVVSTNLALAGAVPVVLFVIQGWLERWYPLGFGITSPPLWSVLSLAAIAAAVVACPANCWMMRRGLIHVSPPSQDGLRRAPSDVEVRELDRGRLVRIAIASYLPLCAVFALSLSLM